MTHDTKMLIFEHDSSEFLVIKPDKFKVSCKGDAERIEAPEVKPFYICMGYKGFHCQVSGNIHVLDTAWFVADPSLELEVTQSVYIEMPVGSVWRVKSKKLNNVNNTVNRYVGDIEFVKVE
jgi:hypothetical protein